MKLGDQLSTTMNFIEQKRTSIIKELTNKKRYSQYFTPVNIAKFMAELFDFNNGQTVKLLDPGAGIGILSTVFCEVAFKVVDKINITAIEIDESLNLQFEENLSYINKNRNLIYKLLNDDYIEWGSNFINDQISLFNQSEERYSHIIMNPPYKKISSNSNYRKILKENDVDTVNLYSAFVGMSIKMLEKKWTTRSDHTKKFL